MTAPRLSLLARLVAGDVDGPVLEAALTVLRSSRHPVSLPGLCNALWFDRGRAGGYDGPAFAEILARVPTFGHGIPAGAEPLAPQPAMPLGALVIVEVGADIAYGEVVWREGAHPLLHAAWVPAWLAGAPSGAPVDRPPPPEFVAPPGRRVRRERLVVDFEVLGTDLAPRAVQLARLRSRGKRLDRFGHLVADVFYDHGLDEADEVGFWAVWCTTTHPAALAAAGVPVEAAALSEAAAVLATALDERDDVRSFGPYYLHLSRYEELLTADDGGPLRRTVHSLAHVHSHDQVAWASMSARLADTAGEDTMIGTDWPTAVVAASLLALDTLAVEAPDGDWAGIHVRLDDAWQGGGLWRAERLDLVGPVAADPAVALGLGWVEHTGGEVARRPSGTLIDDVVPPDWYEDDELDWDVAGSEATWVLHISATDIDADRLRIPGSVRDVVAATLETKGQDVLVVALAHAGENEVREICGLDDNDGHLCFPWPLGLLPGTTVRCSWAVGGTVVRAATALLAQPEEVAGILYAHEFNRAVALAAAGALEGAHRTVTLRQMVRASVRRHGTPTEDGAVALNLDEVVHRCFGPGGELTPGYPTAVLHRAVVAAVAGMAATGAARLDGNLVVVTPRLTAAGRRADVELLARFVDATRQRVRRLAQRHWVAPTIVNLPADWRRSAEKDEAWNDVAGTEGLPAGPLAPNQTWRRGHVRGGALPQGVVADLERTKRALAGIGRSEAATDLEDIARDPYADDRLSPDLPSAPLATDGGASR